MFLAAKAVGSFAPPDLRDTLILAVDHLSRLRLLTHRQFKINNQFSLRMHEQIQRVETKVPNAPNSGQSAHVL